MYKEAGEWFVKKCVKAAGYDTQPADHPLGTRIAQPPALLPWFLEESRKETGREVSEDFPYWEPCHWLLLTHGIANFENVGGDIDRVLGQRCTAFAVPVKWLKGDGSPVRIFALLERKQALPTTRFRGSGYKALAFGSSPRPLMGHLGPTA